MGSVRAEVVVRRTYSRDKDDGTFESWEDIVERTIGHQRWLWKRAQLNGHKQFSEDNAAELNELRQLIITRKVSLAGRTLWLGGTPLSKARESSQFNCSFLEIETIHDIVDAFWLLLNGCGVGFLPITGTLSGFTNHITDVEIIHTKRTDKGGERHNRESFDSGSGIWKIQIGDSAEAWSKSVGKLLAGKYSAKKLIIDFSEIRPAGMRLKGYGWISAGSELIGEAFTEIVKILNKRADQLLARIDILDIMNWLGTVLATRRSAQIALMTYGSPGWREFAQAKNDLRTNPQRQQSNNSLIFYNKPTEAELVDVFDIIISSGGCEPGLINGSAALRRAPWFKGLNPCGEIVMGNKTFCNLTEVNLARFREDHAGLERAVYLVARANYRQTLVNLDDGILQRAWHQNNEFLRLCGVGLTGIIRRSDLTSYDFKRLKNVAIMGAYSMADDLGKQRPKNVTTVKPSGTISKIMDTTEGCHRPPGRYVFNNIVFDAADPLVPELKAAGYKHKEHPYDFKSVIITFPVEWPDVEFGFLDGKHIDNESAIGQLARYKKLMQSWCENNVSITISYRHEEVPSIINWLSENWDEYVGATFMPRMDIREENDFDYLPQQVVSRSDYENYVQSLRPVNYTKTASFAELNVDECASGACPAR